MGPFMQALGEAGLGGTRSKLLRTDYLTAFPFEINQANSEVQAGAEMTSPAFIVFRKASLLKFYASL